MKIFLRICLLIFSTIAHAQDNNMFAIRPLIRIAVLSDSSLSPNTVPVDFFNEQLENQLNNEGFNIQIDSFSNSDDSSLQSSSRMTGLLASEPDIVIVSTGYRDMLNTTPVSIIERNLDEILEQLDAESIYVLFIGMRSTLDKEIEYISDFNEVYASLKDKYQRVTYIKPIHPRLQGQIRNFGTSKFFLSRQGLQEAIKIIAPEIRQQIKMVESTQSMFDFDLMFGYNRPSLVLDNIIIDEMWSND